MTTPTNLLDWPNLEVPRLQREQIVVIGRVIYKTYVFPQGQYSGMPAKGDIDPSWPSTSSKLQAPRAKNIGEIELCRVPGYDPTYEQVRIEYIQPLIYTGTEGTGVKYIEVKGSRNGSVNTNTQHYQQLGVALTEADAPAIGTMAFGDHGVDGRRIISNRFDYLTVPGLVFVTSATGAFMPFTEAYYT